MRLGFRVAPLRVIPFLVLTFLITCPPGIAVLAFAQAPLSDQIQIGPPPLRHAEAPSPSATAEELEKEGDRLRSDKAYLDALDYYRAAAVKNPSSSTLANKTGIVQLQMHRDLDARKSFQTAVRLNRKYAEAHNNLGAAFFQTKNYGKAIKEYRKAIELLETSASFHSNLGTAYFTQKDFAKAMSSYRRALELDPNVFEHSSRDAVILQTQALGDRAQYFYLMARTYAKAGEADRSLSCLRRAIEEGYKDINKVYRDNEFGEIRKDPRFSTLMSHKPVGIAEEPAHN